MRLRCNASACSRKGEFGFTRFSFLPARPLLSRSSSLLSFATVKRETNVAGAEMGQRMLSEPLLQQGCARNPPPEVSRAGVLDPVVYWGLLLLFTGG